MWPPAQQQAPTWPAQQQQAPSWPAQQQPPSLPPQQQPPPSWPAQQQPQATPPQQQQAPTWPPQQQQPSQHQSQLAAPPPPPQLQQQSQQQQPQQQSQQQQIPTQSMPPQQQAPSWPAQQQPPSWPAQYNELPPQPSSQSFQQHQLPPPPPTNPSHNLPPPPPSQHQMQSPQGRSGYMPPPHHAGPYPNQSQPQGPRLNPHSMPSVVQLINDEIETYKKTDMQLKFTAPASLPPLVATLESQQLQMSLHDEGCVRPCHMRSTIYQVPVSKDLLDTSSLEFAVLVKPFDDAEVEGKFYVPVSPNPIVRCNRCKAYVNPFSRNGQCCICNFSSSRGQEMDQRPELHLGSYEFRCTEEYYRDKIEECRRPHIIFAIETTAHSVHMVNYIAKNLAEVIRSHCPKDFGYASTPTPLIGFITFNSKITLHNVRDGYQDYVIADTNSILTPISKFLVDPAENFEDIEKFLATLPDICNDQLEQQAVLGPVIEVALKSCGKDTSNYFENSKKTPNPNVVPTGKIYVLLSSLPNAGDDHTPGRLSTVRNIDELKKSLGTENEGKVLAPEGKYYTQLAQRCINDYASGVELFLVPPHPRAYLNIVTLSELTRLTGTGSINKYLPNSLDNFLHDLKVSLRSTMAFDASMRVRTSTGISPVRYIGNFNNVSGPNLEMSAVNTSSNFIVQMKYDDKLGENDLVVIQFAMIYTSVCGERRVRVHNLALNTCSNLAELYKSACCDTLVNYLVRDTVEKLRFGSLSSKVAKEQLTSRVVSILTGYRKHCTDSQANNISQLILPEGLKLLPVYLCGALKCDAIDGGIEMFPDDKILAQLNLLGATPAVSQVTIYPRMYAINEINKENNNDQEQQMQQVQLQQSASVPNSLDEFGYTATLTRCFRLAIEEKKGQCYILENGHYLFIFYPNTESGQKFLADVYGNCKEAPEISWQMRQTESNETKFLEKLIERIVLERRRALKITVVRQDKDKLEQVFNTFLYEDKKRHEAVSSPVWINANYVEILCFLHSEIRAKLSQ